MFLRVAAMFLSLAVTVAQADEVPGLKTSAYKLKSLVKVFKGVRTESRSARAQFCGERIMPKLRKVENKLVLNLNASVGFDWAEINDLTPESVGGCRYPVVQKIEKSSDSTRLTLLNMEECDHGQAVTESQRDTLVIQGNEITYASEKVVKDRDGHWRTDETKESFICTWTSVVSDH